MNTLQRILTLTALTLLASCANTGGESSAQATIAVLKSSFAEKGPAKLDRLEQTALQQECSQANAAGKPLDEKRAQQISQAILERIPYPKDGVYLGDWKEGEKITQNGRGLQFTDVGNAPNGANCYACHQLSPQELSFGNIGPSLLKYGTLRGVKDPTDKSSEPIVKYTWARIWNTHAFAVCSNMPRFGDAGILTEKQIKDVMALLLDPASPVNK